jgi:hypothetical protein
MLLGTLLSLFPLAFSTKDGLCSTLSVLHSPKLWGPWHQGPKAHPFEQQPHPNNLAPFL